jgi:phospholipid transport system substrate-binding protein
MTKMKMSSKSGITVRGQRLLLTLLVCLLSPSVFAVSPNPVIEEAATLLDEAVKGRRDELAADKQALYDLINDILLPRFDRRYAAQLVLARHWRTASDEERSQFIDAFYNHLMQQYAEAVLEFDLERLEVLPYRGDDTKKRTTVKTTMRLDDGTKVPVNYGMVNRDGKWLMFDVTIEGISYVRNFKAELNAEIQAKGLSGVIKRLEADVSTGESEAAE